MPIDPIDRSSSPGGASGLNGGSAGRRATRVENGEPESVEISDAAKDQLQIHETVLAVRRAAADAPDLRPERVEEVRQRIQQGYYERADVRGSVIDALLRTFQQD